MRPASSSLAGAVLGLVLLGACGVSNDQALEDAALSIVAKYPEDASGLEKGLDASGFNRVALEPALGRLIRSGLIVATPRGLRLRDEQERNPPK